eukprot:UN28436
MNVLTLLKSQCECLCKRVNKANSEECITFIYSYVSKLIYGYKFKINHAFYARIKSVTLTILNLPKKVNLIDLFCTHGHSWHFFTFSFTVKIILLCSYEDFKHYSYI